MVSLWAGLGSLNLWGVLTFLCGLDWGFSQSRAGVCCLGLLESLSGPGWSLWENWSLSGLWGPELCPQRPQVAAESDPKGLSLAGVFRDNVQFPAL